MSSWVSYELQRRRVNERLQKQNDQLEQFASTVSHDLRNPLNVAEGRLELAAEEYDSEHFDAIARALDRMAALIEDLLTLAQEGERIEEVEPTDFRDFAETCWQHVETLDATVEIDADRTIQADCGCLRQLFENLFGNAIEHGGQDVTVTVGVVADGFYVEDDGPGVPENKRGNVFDAGYSTAEDGIGFCLSIVERVTEAHDWKIQVTDGSEGGARFEITGIEFAAE